MTQEDLTANAVSIGGLVMTLAEFKTVLTILVLCTALVLNVVRIIDIKRRAKQDNQEK